MFPTVKHIKYSHFQTKHLGKIYNVRIGSDVFVVEDKCLFTSKPIKHQEKDFILPEFAQKMFLSVIKPKEYKGHVYALKNKGLMPGLIKIGKTKNKVIKRCSDLYSTGVPAPFTPICCIDVDDYGKVETQIHNLLKDVRFNNKREFFCMGEQEVKKLFKRLASTLGGRYRDEF